MTEIPAMYHECRWCGHARAIHVGAVELAAIRLRLSLFRRLFSRRRAYCRRCAAKIPRLPERVEVEHDFQLRVVPCDICGANLITDTHFHPDWPSSSERTDPPLPDFMDGSIPPWMTGVVS